MIPKIIHYVWVGGKRKPHIVKKCIKSWKKFCPNFKLLEWNEGNFDISKYEFAKDAYTAKKYAYVSDVIRLSVLNDFGGIYLDTDMELLKPIDKFLENHGFCGWEDNEKVSCGIIGAEKGDDNIKQILDIYIKTKFLVENGEVKSIVIPRNFTNHFLNYGLKHNGETQIVNNFTIYKNDYFYPIGFYSGKYFSKNTVSIHHWSASWMSKKRRKKMIMERYLKNHRIVKHICEVYKKVKRYIKNN